MMDLLFETLSFALKAGTVVVAVAAILAIAAAIIGMVIANVAARREPADQGRLKMRSLNYTLKHFKRRIAHAGLRGKAMKAAHKQDKEADKVEKKSRDKTTSAELGARVFVLDFDGDVRARRVEQLREEITAIISGAGEQDEVLLRLTSPGGAVSGYGLAASQLARLAQHQISLTVAIDQVAASGGYMMAVVANRIIAAPFAMVGSIGVVATVPNVRRLLLKQGVDVEQLTAGQHKRTLSMLGENTEEGRAVFQADIDDVHAQFKEHVAHYRPKVDIEQVATGGHWTADRAVKLGLVDELLTSDDWLLARQDQELIELKWEPPQSMGSRFGVGVESVLANAGERLWARLSAGPRSL